MSGPRDLFPVVVVVVSGLLALNLSRQVEPSASRCNPTEHVSRRFVPLFADRPQFYEASLLSLFLSLSLSISLSLPQIHPLFVILPRFLSYGFSFRLRTSTLHVSIVFVLSSSSALLRPPPPSSPSTSPSTSSLLCFVISRTFFRLLCFDQIESIGPYRDGGAGSIVKTLHTRRVCQCVCVCV